MHNLAARYGTTARRLTNVDRLDPDAFLDVSRFSIVRDLMAKDFGLAQSVHERGAPSPRSAL